MSEMPIAMVLPSGRSQGMRGKRRDETLRRRQINHRGKFGTILGKLPVTQFQARVRGVCLHVAACPSGFMEQSGGTTMGVDTPAPVQKKDPLGSFWLSRDLGHAVPLGLPVRTKPFACFFRPWKEQSKSWTLCIPTAIYARKSRCIK